MPGVIIIARYHRVLMAGQVRACSEGRKEGEEEEERGGGAD